MHARSRRTLLTAGVAGVAASGLAGCEREAPSAAPKPAASTSSTGVPPTTLTAPDFDPADWESVLRERGIVGSATPYRTSHLRLGPSIVTTPEQVDAAVEEVATLGG